MKDRRARKKLKGKLLRTVELFSGIGGFRLACDQLQIKTVWANDINPLSCDVYKDVFGRKGFVEGDIRDIHSEVPPHDVLTAGFPCQPFSNAGKKQGIRDPRGTLFKEIVTVLRASNPRWFILENVKRLLSMEKGDHFATILLALSELNYSVEWRLLNTTAFGLPQNRQRVVVVGKRLSNPDGVSVVLATHEDLKNLIRRDLSGLKNINQWKSLAKHRGSFPTWGMCFKKKFYASSLESFSEASVTPSLESILESDPPEDFFMEDTISQRLAKSEYVNKLVNGVRILYNQGGGARMGYTVFGTDGLSPTLTASHSRHYERYRIGTRYRRLTNVEYARLQGFSDNHCSVATVFNQYGLYGNAVPPPLARWVVDRVIGERALDIASIEPVDNTQLALKL